MAMEEKTRGQEPPNSESKSKSITKSNGKTKKGGNDRMNDPMQKAFARSISSFFTWYMSEYPKLLIQRGKTIKELTNAYRKTSISSHLQGSLSSVGQRGASAFLMFYGQNYISTKMGTPTEIPMVNAGLSGFVSGGLSSLVHTIFEPMKIRLEKKVAAGHSPLSINQGIKIYTRSLKPMFWRHALFDGTFFATSSLVQDHSYSIQFAVSAFMASCANLTHDVWKTKLIRSLPYRVTYLMILRNMTFREYSKQLIWKSFDLSTNWFITGLIFSSLFAKQS